MSVESFLDTNVFVYQLDTEDERKTTIANSIIRDAVETGRACISFQVIQECLNTALNKARIPVDVEEARDYLETILAPLLRVMPSIDLYGRGLEIKERYGFSFYDSLIVAAALDAGCTRLLTEDLQDGQEIDGLHIENPFSSNH